MHFSTQPNPHLFNRTLLSVVCILIATTVYTRKTITACLTPEMNILAQIHRYHPFAGHPGKELDSNIPLTMMSRYGTIINRLRDHEADAAFPGSLSVVPASPTCQLT